MKFFDPCGNELTQEEFIDFYSKCYYMSNNKDVEDTIEKLLKKDELSKEDIFNILAWKIGKISHKNSTEDELVFHEGWNIKTLETNVYGKKLDIQSICEKLRDLNNKDLDGYLDALKGFSGLGPVYIITLRFFVTKGQEPIYDRFAYRALHAIEDGTSPKTIKEKELTFENAVKQYGDYCDLLKKVFSENWNKRSVDKALWAYGHLLCGISEAGKVSD